MQWVHGNAVHARQGKWEICSRAEQTAPAPTLHCDKWKTCTYTTLQPSVAALLRPVKSPPLPRHAPWRGTATPRSVARQARPRQRSAIPVAVTSARCRATMHGAAQTFGRARAIGAAKSVSFKKNPTVLDLKLYSKKG